MSSGRSIAPIPRVVHQEVDAAERLDGVADHGLDLFDDRDVAWVKRDVSVHLAQGRHGGLRHLVVVKVVHHQRRALAYELFADARADPAAAAGDERHHAGEREWVRSVTSDGDVLSAGPVIAPPW
jgi:hypothetical protein